MGVGMDQFGEAVIASEGSTIEIESGEIGHAGKV